MAIALPEAFVWGNGGTRRTPEQIERDQKMALLLMKQGTDYSPIQHWTQGGARVMSALAGVVRERKADQAALANSKHSEGIINSLLNAQTTPSVPPQAASPVAPPAKFSPFAPPPAQNNSPFAAPPVGDANPSMQEAQQEQPVLPSITESAPVLQNTSMTQGEFTPQQRALLETIAGPESAGNYNIMYSPQQRRLFDSYADHPRSPARILKGPNAGRVSDAAGKYQFLSRTWDEYKNKLGLTDFSPQSQDRAAWTLASDVFKQRTGQDLNAVLQSGDPQALANVGRVLSGTWTSLPGGIEQGINQNAFVSAFQRNLGGNNQQTAPLFLGDSHASALAQFGKGKSQGVNGATIAQAIQQLQRAPRGANVVMSAGTNDAVGQFNEQAIRAQVQQAAQLAKQNGINLTWAGPTGPNAAALDAILSDATRTNGINYRSMVGGKFAMQPDGIHAQLSPQGYGAMWDAINQQPQAQAPQQPYQVASLSPVGLPEQQQVPPSIPPQQQAQPEQPAHEQVAQLSQGPQSVNDFGFRAPVQAQAPQQAPQASPQQQTAPQRPQINPMYARVMSDPYASPQAKAIASSLLQRDITANQPKYDVKTLPNGDLVHVDERSGSTRVIHSAPKTNFGVIGKDEFGRDKYGFINPQQQSVTPYNAPQQQQQGPSVIPPVPNGVDPALWQKYHSEKLSKDSLGPTDESVTKLRGEIRDLPSYKNMAVVAPAYNRMVKSAGNDNRAADLSLVYTFMKMLDPGSVTRESEVSMAQNVPTLPEQYRNSLMSFLTGKGRLDPQVRQALLAEAKVAAQSYRTEWDRDKKLYEGIMTRRKINQEDVFSDFEPFGDFAPPSTQQKTLATPPAGVDAKVWKHMTPEERALWK